MWLEHVREVLVDIENNESIKTRESAIRELRKLGLDEFGVVMFSVPHPDYPKLSSLLPAMASDDVQRRWTGNSGFELLKITSSFVRLLSYNFTRLTGQPLDNATTLDFGCGYGRMARLLYYFTDEQNFFGLDPWNQSIEVCQNAGLTKNFLISDYLPHSLPVGTTRFDLIYAFSVFTHLSKKAALTALNTLRDYVNEDGVLAITIRPIEYWQLDPKVSEDQKNDLIASHQETGFAFHPHDREPVDGDITYGDTSMTVEWLTQNCPRWKVVATDSTLIDAYQRCLFLRPQ